jgi:hypothetical protein
MTTKYLASPQNRLVPSGEHPSSSSVRHKEQTVRVHAVAAVDGVLAGRTACRRFVANVEDPDRSFVSINAALWCGACAQALGVSHVA